MPLLVVNIKFWKNCGNKCTQKTLKTSLIAKYAKIFILLSIFHRDTEHREIHSENNTKTFTEGSLLKECN